VLYNNPAYFLPGSVPHPPLTEFIYRIVAPHFGYDNYRVFPLTFSIINFFLIFLARPLLFDKKSAFWTVFLFAIHFTQFCIAHGYVDGSVMPFFFS